MQLSTTFRGLDKKFSNLAAKTLERNLGRLQRLVDDPASLRCVVEGGPPEHRIVLDLTYHNVELTAQSSDHDLVDAINIACERLRAQLAKQRSRRSSLRHRSSPRIAA